MYCVYRRDSGAAVSWATVVDPAVLAGTHPDLLAVAVSDEDRATKQWDAATRTMVTRPVQTTTVISRQDFLDRLGPEVEVAVQLATQGTDANAAMLRAFILRLTVVGEVHVDDPRTIGAVQALVTFGLIDMAKMTAVLAPKVVA